MSRREEPARCGSAVFVPAGDQVRYSTPSGAEYVSICRPAFSPDLVHRTRGADTEPGT